jgi:hypothetical protein
VAPIALITALHGTGRALRGARARCSDRDDAYFSPRGADALIIVTEWEHFRALGLARLKTNQGTVDATRWLGRRR